MKETDDVCIGAGSSSRTSSIFFLVNVPLPTLALRTPSCGKGAVKVILQAARNHWKYPMNVEQRLSLIWRR